MTHAVRSLKRAVLREEFVALTGDAFQALVLNQFIYWVQKVNDFDDFIREEQERNPDCNVSLRHGWIYKKAQELIEETMLQMSDITMRRIIKVLIEKGWIEERTNPDNRWNKVLQYRPDLKKIQQDLYGRGYALPGFPLLQPAQRSEAPKLQIEVSKLQNEGSNLQTDRFILKDTKTTSEITAKNSADTREDFSKSMLETWNRLLCPPVPVQMTAERCSRLNAVLGDFFQGKIESWERFCQDVTQSSFLMGQGQRRWKAPLDWILTPANLQKTLEGNYWDSEASPASPVTEKPSSRELKLKVEQHLESLSHPLSRQFCRGLLRHLPEQKFLFWFGEAAFSGWEESCLVLSFPSRATRDYVERHFSSEMGSAARRVCPDLKSLSLGVQEPPASIASQTLENDDCPQTKGRSFSGYRPSSDLETSGDKHAPGVDYPEERESLAISGEEESAKPSTFVAEGIPTAHQDGDSTRDPEPLPFIVAEPLCPDVFHGEHENRSGEIFQDTGCASGTTPTSLSRRCVPQEPIPGNTLSSLSSLRSRSQDDTLSALQGYFPDRNNREACVIGESEGDRPQNQASTFLQSSKEEYPWKQAVKGFPSPSLSSHPLTERSPL